MFFTLKPKKATLSDINPYLIITYKVIRDDVQSLIKLLKLHSRLHNSQYYQKARSRFNKEKNPVRIAALFIYLNKTCFNGLYRVNKKGMFNVPEGKYKNPKILDESNLLLVSKTLKKINILLRGFEQTQIRKNCLYYLDPPYHRTYSNYDHSGFGEKEHQMLAEFCFKINKRGGYFMLSNSNTSFIRKLYKGFVIKKVSALRSVSCKSFGRTKETELINKNY